MNTNLRIALDLLTVLLLLFGLLFIVAASVGLLRMPDLYHRIHAMTKGVTLGMIGLLLAAVVHLLSLPQAGGQRLEVVVVGVAVILFQFVANPVGGHVLAKAAHRDGVEKWSGTLSDELEEDLGQSSDRG